MKELNKELEKIDEKIKKNPVYSDILELYKEILKAKNRYKDILKVEPLDIDEEMIESAIKNEFPAVRKDKINADFEALEKYFFELLNLFKEKEEDLAEELKSAIQRREINLKELVRDVLVRGVDTKGENGDAEEESWSDNKTVRLLIYEALRPVMESYSQTLKDKIKDEDWGKGVCPVCGEKPRMAELRGEEGKRIFLCSLCSHEWSFMRVKCPFCENDNQEELGYLSVEGEPNYRINICKKCKGYIKTIDTKDFGEDADVSLVLEDITTLHLDILAKKEGFKKENIALFYP